MKTNKITTIGGVEIKFRTLIPNDIPFVMKSWLATHKDSETGSKIDEKVYYALTRPVVEKLLSDQTLIRVVATIDDDDNMIAGFIVADVVGPILHYLHTRGAFRNLGIAKALLDYCGFCKQIPFAATFDTKDLRRSIKNGWQLKLKPELLEEI